MCKVKRLTSALCCAAMCFAMAGAMPAMQVSAEVQRSDVVQYAVTDGKVLVDISVPMNCKSDDITLLAVWVNYDSTKLKPVAINDKGKFVAKKQSIATEFSTDLTSVDGTVAMMWLNGFENFNVTGKVATVEFEVLSGVTDTSFTFTVKTEQASTYALDASENPVENRTTYINGGKIGDVNGNKKIDTGDYGQLRKYFLQGNGTGMNATIVANIEKYGDVNGNGKVDTGDYGQMRRYVLSNHSLSTNWFE